MGFGSSRPSPDWSKRVAEVARKENAQRVVRPVRVARRMSRATAVGLSILIAAGIVAAVIFASNILQDTSTVAGTALTIQFDPNNGHPHTFAFAGTSYNFGIQGCSNTGAALTGTLTVKLAKSGIVPGDVTLKRDGTSLTPTQPDASTLQYDVSGVSYPMCPSVGTSGFAVVFNTAGTYGWSIVGNAVG